MSPSCEQATQSNTGMHVAGSGLHQPTAQSRIFERLFDVHSEAEDLSALSFWSAFAFGWILSALSCCWHRPKLRDDYPQAQSTSNNSLLKVCRGPLRNLQTIGKSNFGDQLCRLDRGVHVFKCLCFLLLQVGKGFRQCRDLQGSTGPSSIQGLQ